MGNMYIYILYAIASVILSRCRLDNFFLMFGRIGKARKEMNSWGNVKHRKRIYTMLQIWTPHKHGTNMSLLWTWHTWQCLTYPCIVSCKSLNGHSTNASESKHTLFNALWRKGWMHLLRMLSDKVRWDGHSIQKLQEKQLVFTSEYITKQNQSHFLKSTTTTTTTKTSTSSISTSTTTATTTTGRQPPPFLKTPSRQVRPTRSQRSSASPPGGEVDRQTGGSVLGRMDLYLSSHRFHS